MRWNNALAYIWVLACMLLLVCVGVAIGRATPIPAPMPVRICNAPEPDRGDGKLRMWCELEGRLLK